MEDLTSKRNHEHKALKITRMWFRLSIDEWLNLKQGKEVYVSGKYYKVYNWQHYDFEMGYIDLQEYEKEAE